MRKMSIVLAAVAVTGITVAAKALPETTLFLDIRDNIGAGQSISAPVLPFTAGQGDFPNDGLAGPPAAPSGGGKGCGQVLRITPVTTTGSNTAAPASYPAFDDTNTSTGSLWLYADVVDDAGAVGAGDVISSIGLDFTMTLPTQATGNKIASTSFAWRVGDPAPGPNDTTANFGTNNGTNAGLSINGAKYVKVPVDTASMYATAGGLTPGTMFRIGKLSVVGATRDCNFITNHATLGSTYTLSMGNNNVLTTRTFSNVVADVDERVSYGYTGGAPEADVSGNTTPTVGNANRDAVIQVRCKDDTNGNGLVNSQDIPGFNAAGAPGTNLTQAQRYLYDRNNNGIVNSQDIPQFTSWSAVTCP